MSLEISIIVPAYNESKSLQSLVGEITAVLSKIGKQYEIIVVDDGSTDETFSVLLKLQKQYPYINIIQLRRNFGQSAALDAGIKHSKGKVLVTIDADGQNDPKDIPKMLDQLRQSKSDCVCGWRRQRRDSFIKKIISKGASFLGNFLVNAGIHDSGCTLRVAKKECFSGLDLYGELHRMIPALLKWRGFSLAEIKVNHRPRKFGKSKYNFVRIIHGLTDMISIWFWRKYQSRPMHIFGGVGILLTSLGLLLLVCLTIARYFLNYSLSDKIWPLVGFFLLLIGGQFFVFGILAGIIIQNNGNKEFYLIKEIVKNKPSNI